MDIEHYPEVSDLDDEEVLDEEVDPTADIRSVKPILSDVRTTTRETVANIYTVPVDLGSYDKCASVIAGESSSVNTKDHHDDDECHSDCCQMRMLDDIDDDDDDDDDYYFES